MATSSTPRAVRGAPVLVIHGSAGGYDQGELIVQTVLDDRFHWITPSRFGYLQSTFRNGATFDEQAHAYLDVQRVAVVVLSHGGPSALLFAVLHPERVSSLTLISCGVGPMATDDQAEADQKGKMPVRIFKHDVMCWMMTKLFATFAAAAIPDARLLSFESGGHLVIGIEQATIRAAVQQHILDNVSEMQPARL